MAQEIFSYLYPMPDDIAQSMLIAETETRIHIRPVNELAKRTWIHNKLLRNLLTERKTIILVDKLEDSKLIEDCIQKLELESLVLFFNHSRSDIEKKLQQFHPLTVAGKLQTQECLQIGLQLQWKFQNLHSKFQISQHKIQSSSDSLINQICRYVRLNSRQIEFTQNGELLISYSSYRNLKQSLDSFQKNIAGCLPMDHPLQKLNHHTFELFLPEEAWSYIAHYLAQWNKGAKKLLSEIRWIEDELKSEEFKKLKDKLVSLLQDLYILHALDSNPTSRIQIEKQLSLERLQEWLKDFEIFINPEDIHDLHSILSLQEQLLQKLRNKVQGSQELLEVSSDTPASLSIRHWRKQSASWISELENTQILHSNQNPGTEDIEELKSTLQFLAGLSDQILKSESLFQAFYEWKKLSQNLQQDQLLVLDHLLSIHPNHWHEVLDQIYLNGLIEKHQPPDLEELGQFRETLKNYKHSLPPYLKSRYEKIQYQGIQKLKTSSPQLFSTMIEKKEQSFGLTDYYQNLSYFSDVFPIIVLECAHPEYFPANVMQSWDEIWNLCPQLNTDYLGRFEKASQRFVSIYSEFSSSGDFHIALNQSAPRIAPHFLNTGQSQDKLLQAQNTASFIYSNFPNFRIFVNPECHCLSFLPKSLESLILQWSNSNWNQISLTDEDPIEKLTEILLFDRTSKKIWVSDGIFQSQSLGLQQLEWQFWFMEWLREAGFEVENFWTSRLHQYKDFLKLDDQHLFVESRRPVMSRT